MISFSYRTATQEEMDDQIHHKCVTLLPNHMQCSHKVAKVVTTKETPNDPGKYVYYCMCHFYVNLARIKEIDGISIINEDEDEAGVGVVEETPVAPI
jgi:hypothetical protein